MIGAWEEARSFETRKAQQRPHGAGCVVDHGRGCVLVISQSSDEKKRGLPWCKEDWIQRWPLVDADAKAYVSAPGQIEHRVVLRIALDKSLLGLRLPYTLPRPPNLPLQRPQFPRECRQSDHGTVNSFSERSLRRTQSRRD